MDALQESGQPCKPCAGCLQPIVSLILPLCGCKSVTAIVGWIKMTHPTIHTEKQWAVMTHCR